MGTLKPDSAIIINKVSSLVLEIVFPKTYVGWKDLTQLDTLWSKSRLCPQRNNLYLI